MDILKRVFGLFLIFLIAFVFSACKSEIDTSWIIKYDGKVMPIGIFKYYLKESYNKAVDILTAAGAYSQESTNDSIAGKSFDSWIRDDAVNSCKDLIALESLFNSEGLSFNEMENSEMKANAENILATISQNLEKNYLSLEDVKRAYSECKAMYKKLFDHYYKKGGSKFVTDDALLEYYKQNYVSYSMVTVYPFVFSESSGVESGSNISLDQLNKTKSIAEDYVNQINAGEKTLSDVSNTINERSGKELGPPNVETVNLDSANVPENILIKLKALDVGKADYVQVDDFFVILYKLNINDSLPDLGKEDVRDDVLNCMKQNEFYDILAETKRNIRFEVNAEFLNSFVPKNIFKDS